MTDYKETYILQIKKLEDKIKLLEKDNDNLTRIIVSGKASRNKLLVDGIILGGDYNKTPANQSIW